MRQRGDGTPALSALPAVAVSMEWRSDKVTAADSRCSYKVSPDAVPGKKVQPSRVWVGQDRYGHWLVSALQT